MRTMIMSRTSNESSSRRHFRRIISKVEAAADSDSLHPAPPPPPPAAQTPPRGPVARIRAALTSALSGRSARPGQRVTGTLYGPRRGHVRFAFQVDPRAAPSLLVELALPTASLVKEMASGLLRIALECDRKPSAADGGARVKLVEERLWRAFCNGKKCGFAVRKECAAADWRLLRAVEPVSMGAGVLPEEKVADGDGGGGGRVEAEMMYMRARFERVVGSRDSEAFYMMNPDGGGWPELSIYLLRV